MTKRFPTEFAINMCLEKMMIIQQSELGMVNQMNYFDANDPCHLYFICRRPRIIIDEKVFNRNDDHIELNFKIQIRDEFKDLPIKLPIEKDNSEYELETKYPFNKFKIIQDGNMVLDAKVAVFIQSLAPYLDDTSFVDLEVLYIGQSYGVEGARTAPDRLKNHSTLQGIYAEAISNNPDSEIWLALASFSQINLMMFDGRTKFSEEEKEEDKSRFLSVYDKLNWEGINEQQKINFTEAALIRYFRPPYNSIYKDSFPNPAHSTYQECYDLEINSVCIEMNTYEMIRCMFYSDAVERTPWNMKDFLLRSPEERKSMFEIE